MKVDEIAFFYYCYSLRTCYGVSIRDIIDQCFNGVIHPKRCWYLLKKWARLGFMTMVLVWISDGSTQLTQCQNDIETLSYEYMMCRKGD